MMDDDAQKCLEASERYAQRGRQEESLLLLERAVLARPADGDLVLRYVREAVPIAEAEAEPRAERLEALEAFVRGRLLHVGLDRFEEVMRCADGLRERWLASSTEVESDASMEPIGARAAEILAAVHNDALDDTPPPAPE